MMAREDNLERTWAVLGGPVRYFAKSHGRTTGGWCKTIDSLRRTINALQHWDFYVTLNPTVGLGVKAKSSDVTHWSRILIDIDPTSSGAIPELATGYAMGRLAYMFPSSIDAVTVVMSGRGGQLWLDVDSPVMSGRLTRREVEESISNLFRWLNLGMIGSCRIDPSCSDLGRVARCPGTINQKTGVMAHILERYSATPPLTPVSHLDILRAFPPEPPKQKEPITGPVNLSGLLPHLSQRASAFLTEGIASPGRHSAAYAAAASLRDMGVDEGTARQLVQLGGLICRPPLSREECSTAVRNAYAKEKE